MHSQFDYFVTARSVQKFMPTHAHLHRADAEEAIRSDLRDRIARKRFYLLYRLRNLLYRLSDRLADRIAL